MEAYICDDHSVKEKSEDNSNYNHLIILAKNKVGYKNLIHLSSFAYTEGFYYKPRIDFKELEAHKDGLIVSSACCAGEIPKALWGNDEAKARKIAQRYKETFGTDFYLEIMIHSYENDKEQENKEKKLAGMLYNMGKDLGIKCICTQDTHYARKGDWEAHDVLLAVQTHNVIKNPDRFTFSSKDFYLKPYEQMAELYKKVPELLENTKEIADKIESPLIVTSQDLLPNFSVPEGFKDEEAYLKELVKCGMIEKGLINKQVYRDRIKYEMSVITKCKYTKYFLILWDIINFARENKIRVGAGRGCFLPDNKVDEVSGSKSISEIKIGDKVLSYDGKFHDVLNKFEYDINEDIIEIGLEDGRKITCTSDHEIHVKRGVEIVWVKANELSENDEIYDIRCD
jgi:DNA polymerase-3 subunit alpha